MFEIINNSNERFLLVNTLKKTTYEKKKHFYEKERQRKKGWNTLGERLFLLSSAFTSLKLNTYIHIQCFIILHYNFPFVVSVWCLDVFFLIISYFLFLFTNKNWRLFNIKKKNSFLLLLFLLWRAAVLVYKYE